jgi:hypothetical protein
MPPPIWGVCGVLFLYLVVLGPEGEGMGGETEQRGPHSSDTPAALRSELVWVHTDGHLFELRTYHPHTSS